MKHNIGSILFLCFLLFTITSHTSQAQTTWYVNHAATGNNNGTTQQDAFRNLDDALSVAADNDTIKVAVGIYKPSQMLPGGTTGRDNTFYITKSITLLGGYNQNFLERDVYLNSTILDGDIGTNSDKADNCYHVLVWNSPGESGTIDGFTIKNGNANNATIVSGVNGINGGGLYIISVTSLTLSNITFQNNTATGNGGAIYNGSATNGATTITQSLFTQNIAGLGGAIYSITGGTAGFNKIINSTFSKDTATAGGGGAVYLSSTVASSSKIAYCTFNGNTASNNKGNAIFYPTNVARELKGNLIYGNGTGVNSEIENPNTTSPNAVYNLIRNQALSGIGNISVADGNAANIYHKMAADGTAELDYYGGNTQTLMPVRLGFAHNKIPETGASSIEPTSIDQRGYIRPFDGAAEMGAVEIDWKWPDCKVNTTWYVDALTGATLNSGASIFEPVNDLSMVLENPCLKAGDTIMVAGDDQGGGSIYRPTVILGATITGSNRDRAFNVTKSITLLGGYDNSFGIRNPATYKTVLDGDWGVLGDNTDNSYHVMVWSAADGQLGTIDGFTIRNGNANGSGTNVVVRNSGGGIFQNSGALNIKNTTFQNNLSGSTGGAIHSIAALTSAAVLNIDHSNFLSNTAISNGGAIYRSSANGTLNISKSTFANNSGALGGALYSDVNNTNNLNYISNSTFSGNRASGTNGGGAIYFSSNAASTSKITYSTFNANKATSNVGNAIRYGSATQDLSGNIIYGNGTGTNTEISTIPIKPNGVMYNIIRDMTVTGAGNTGNQNVSAGNGNYIFKDVVGDSAILADNGGQTQTLMLLQGSLAQNRIPATSGIDALVNTDQRDESRYAANFSIGSVELPLECNPAKVWYVNAAAPAGGTGLSTSDPISDLSLLLTQTCLQTGDTVKVVKGTYTPNAIPFEATTDNKDRNFLIPVSIHLLGGYEPGFNEPTRDTTGATTFLDGDFGTNKAYHVVVWNTTDGQTGSINGFTIQNGNGNLGTVISGVTRNKGAGLNLNQGNLILRNTIVQNNTSTGTGGGVHNQSGNLTLENSTVQNNTTTSTGGGIHNESGNVTLVNTIVQNNTSTSTGAGIQSQTGTILTLLNSTINANKASNNGGGIYANQTVVLDNTTISNNTATGTANNVGLGGGVYALKDIELKGKVIISNNMATGTNTGSGAGIYKAVSAGTSFLATQLDTLILTGNRAMFTTGGGIYAGEDFEMTNLKYANISNNYAKTSGGGIYANKLLTLSNADSIIIQNDTAGNHGGGIYANNILTLSQVKNLILQNNKSGYDIATNTYSTTAYNGAGIYANNALTLSGKVTLSNNIASGTGAGIHKIATGNWDVTAVDTLIVTDNIGRNGQGGGINSLVAATTGSMDFTNLKYANISNNSAPQHGGGIYATNALNMPNAQNIILQNNKAGYNGTSYTGAYHGGGIYAANALTLSGKVEMENNSAANSGGAIYKVATGTFDVNAVDTLILTSNNALGATGGGIYMANVSAEFNTLKYLEILDNKAKTHGGGIYAGTAASTTINLLFPNASRIVIEDNRAGYDFTTQTCSGANNGGGIWVWNNFSVSGKMTLKDNIAGGSGGAIYKNLAANTTFLTAQLDSVIAENNEAITGQGGAIYTGNSMDFINAKGRFSNNKAGTDGGAVCATGAFSISDFIMENNTAGRNGGAIFDSISILNLIGYMEFKNNTANFSGGAVYAAGTISVANLDSVIFENNRANTSGGAIYTKGDMQFYGLIKGDFRGNTALQHGGAIYAEKAVSIQNTVFQNNKANNIGGAIYATGNKDVSTTVKRSTFNNNSGSIGGAIYYGNTGGSGSAVYMSLSILQSTFAGNTAAQHGGAIASYNGTIQTSAASQQYFTNNTFSGNKAGGNGGAIYFGYTGGASNAWAARATIAFNSFNYNTSNGSSNAIHYEKTDVATDALGTLFGNIIYNGPNGSEINDISKFSATTALYNIGRNLALPAGTGNQNVSTIDDIFETVIGDSAALANNGGATKTLLIKKDGSATNLIPQSAAIVYATNDQRDENRIVNLADIGSVELYEDLCANPTPNPVVWYVDSTIAIDNEGTLISSPAKYLETVLNNPCLKDGDTVKVAKGTYFSTNTLATQSFFVTKSIVIKGGYSTGDFSETNRNITTNQTIFDGKNTSHHTVVWNTGEIYTGIIDGVTIQKGKATGTITTGTIPQNKGGGLFLSLGKLIVSNTTIQDNIAISAGGGIYSSEDAVLTLQNTRSFRNKAGYNGTSFATTADGTDLVKQIEKSGGSVCVLGSFTMIGSLLFQNDEAGVNGGGIFKGTFNNTDASLLDTLTMVSCIANVTSGGSSSSGNHGGGGIYTMCALDMTNAKKLYFQDCKAPASVQGEGGGIFINNKTGRLISLKVANAEFINCVCGDDGGALESYGGTVSIIYAKDSYFKGCFAGRFGGAFGCGHAIELAGKIVIDSCTSGSNGGGISQWVSSGERLPLMFNAMALDTLIVTRCGTRSALVNSASASQIGGGGIWVEENDCDLSNVKYLYFADNYSGEHGAGIKIQTVGYKLTLGNNNVFRNNKAGFNGTTQSSGSYDGGAIYNIGGNVELRGRVQLDSNTTSRHGGGIYVASTYSIVTTGVDTLIMRGNKSLNGSGGGFYTSTLSLSNLKNSDISNNYAKINGGAIYVSGAFDGKHTNFTNNQADGIGGAMYANSTFNAANVSFINNKANGGNGGAIYAGGVFQVSDANFQTNQASGSGGAVHANSAFTTTNANFLSNKSGNDGGAIYANTTFLATNTTFTNNQAIGDGKNGGAVYGNNTFEANYTNFIGNTASNGGAIWKARKSKITVTKSTFAQNEAKFGGAIYSAVDSGANYCTFTGLTFSRNKATSGDGGALYLATNDVARSVTQILFSTFNANTATGNGNAIYYAQPASEIINGSILYGNSTQDINNTAGLVANYNIFKQLVNGTGNIQVPAGSVGSIFADTIASTETAVLGDHGGKSQTLAIKVGGYAHNVTPSNVANAWVGGQLLTYTDQRDSIRWVGCKVDAGSYELQASKYALSSYTLKENVSVCGNVPIYPSMLIDMTVNMKDTLYFSDNAYTQQIYLPASGLDHIYIQFKSNTNCEYYDSVVINFTSVVPVADIVEETRIVCAGSTVNITARAQTGINYVWSNYADFSTSHSGQNTNRLTFTATSPTKDTSFYIYVTASSGCGSSKDSVLITLRGVPTVKISVPNNIIADACVSKPFTFTVQTTNTTYYTFLPAGANVTGRDKLNANATVGYPNAGVTRDTGSFEFDYTPAAADKGKNLTLILRSTGDATCGYRQDTMHFLILPEPTAAKLEIISQPRGLQKICRDTVYTLKIKATNVGGLINNRISLVDMGASHIIVDSAKYLYPVTTIPNESDWKSLGNRDSLTDAVDRVPRYQYDSLPNLNGNDSMLVRFYVNAGCGFRSGNTMKFKANVFDKCGTAVGISDMVSNLFRLESDSTQSNTYTFDDSFTPSTINPKITDSVVLRIKVTISGSFETDSTRESIIADYPDYFVPDLATFDPIRNAGGTVTTKPSDGGKTQYSLPIPSGLKGSKTTFTDSVIFSVRCYTGNVPCGQMELWNQVFYSYKTDACGDSCEVTNVRAQSIDSINIERYNFTLTDEVKGTTQLGKWGDTIDVLSLTPFLADDSIRVQFFVDKNANHRYDAPDVLVDSMYIYSGAGIASGNTFQVPFLNIPYESGYQLLAYSNDVKLCVPMTIPINVISGPDTVCQGDTAIFEAPAGMYGYTFDAISGATIVPDHSLPENQLKVYFKEALVDTAAIRGFYYRIIPNSETHENDTIASAKSTFRFYVNPAITADSIAIVDNSTEICTPNVIKLYAKDLKHAAAHQWVMPAETGTMLNENADTLVYTLNSRSADTTIFVYYTATGLTSCGNWKDSIQLTLYQTLSQPDLEFSDTTVCKNTSIQINMDLPSGGGTTDYTYQWQDSIRGRGWQNSTENIFGYTNTSQNYITENLNDTVWYKRIATAQCDKDTSKIIQINVRQTVATLNIAKSKDTVCSGSTKDIVVTSTNATDIIWTYIDENENRQELQYPNDNIAGIGSVSIDSDKKKIIFASEKQLSDVICKFEITAKDKCGDVMVVDTILLRGYPTGKIVALQDTAVCYGTAFNFASVLTNSTYIGYEADRAAGFFKKDETTIIYQKDSLTNYYTPIANEANSTIKLRLKYRNDVCDYQYDSIRIFVLPKTTSYTAELITQPQIPQEICADTVYEIKIKATDIGNLANVQIMYHDMFNSHLQVKSFAYKNPYNAANWSYLPDSIATDGGTKITWTLPGQISSGDSMLVRTSVSPVCGFQSGFTVDFHINIQDVCGHEQRVDTLLTNPFITVQDTLMKGSFQVLTSFNGAPLNTTGNITLNSTINDTVLWRLVAVPGSGTSIDTNRQFMQVALPLAFPIVSGSYVPVKNAPNFADLSSSVEGSSLILQFPVVQSMANDSCIVEFKFLAGNAPCRSYKELSAEVVFRDSVRCGDTTCAFFSTFGKVNPIVDVQRYVFTLDTIKGYTQTGFWNAEVNLKALNGFFASDSVKVDFYVDENNNNGYDAGDGNAVATHYLKSSTDILPGGILKVNFPDIPVIYGKQLIAYSTDSLLCATTQFPITIMTGQDTVCTTDTMRFVFPEGMSDYHTDGISGATTVPLPGSNVNNYPNENVRQYVWQTKPTTSRDLVATGSYTRTFPNSIIQASEKTSFHTYVNPTPTYNRLVLQAEKGRIKQQGFVAGNNKQVEICTPDIVKIYAENVTNIVSRKWTAPATVGNMSGETTDTLLYKLYPRTTDTVFWVYYQGQCLSGCVPIFDSIELTLRTTLTNPEPHFIDTIICKNTSIELLEDIPLGGGTTGYTYQWQDSTQTRGWQDINTAQEQNYTTPNLDDTTWYRRIVTSYCDSDTGTVIRVAVYPPLEVKSIQVDYPLCMSDSIRISWQIKGGKQPYMYSFDGGMHYTNITHIDSVTTSGYTVCHIDTLLKAGNYVIGILDSTRCLSIDSTINIKPNSASAEPRTDVLFVKTIPSGNADGFDWDNAFDGKYLAWYLKNKAQENTKIYVAEGTYIPYMDSCDNLIAKRAYAFELNHNMQIKGGFAAMTTGTDTVTTYNPKNNVTRLSGEIQNDADATNNSYHVVTVAENAGVWIDGFYISDGYAFDMAGDNNVPFGPNGGGIYDHGGTFPTNVRYSNLIIENNAAKYGGGAYINKNQYSKMQRVIIRNNTNLENSSGGAGIFAWGNLTLDNATISNNINGSGITSWGGNILLRNTTISGNAKYGIEADNSISGNGIGIELINTTVSANDTGIVLKNYHPDSLIFNADNTLITGNTTDVLFGGDYPIDTATLKYTIIGMTKYETGKTDFHNINISVAVAPLADNGGWGETHALLNPCENPAVQAGNASLLSNDTLKYDQRGVLRKNPPSIGAYDQDETILITLNKPTKDTVCANTFYEIESTVTVPFGLTKAHQWYKDGVALTDSTKSSLTFDSIEVSNTGKYTLLVTTNQAGCSRMSDTVNVFVRTAPQATIGNNGTICYGDKVFLEINITSGIAPWSVVLKTYDENGDYKTGADITIDDITGTLPLPIKYKYEVSPQTTTTYKIFTVTDGNGCVTVY